MLDFLFAGTALVADADDGEEENSSTSAETVEDVVVDGFDVVIGGSLGFLVSLWGGEHVGNLDLLVLIDRFKVRVGNLLIKLGSLFWLEVGFEPVLKSEIGFHVLIWVSDDHDATLDSHGVGLPNGGLLVTWNHTLCSFKS